MTPVNDTSPTPDPSPGKAMAEAPPERRTAWTLRQRVVRLLWGTIGRLLWFVLPRCRPSLLRLFGGKVGRNCEFAGRVEITIPWNIEMGDECRVAERVILYSLGPITLGTGVRLDIRSHLCAGSHDMRDTRFPLERPPISIGDGSFIGVDAYIAPGVTVGKNCVVWPRASVYSDIPDSAKVRGNPAKVVP